MSVYYQYIRDQCATCGVLVFFILAKQYVCKKKEAQGPPKGGEAFYSYALTVGVKISGLEICSYLQDELNKVS